jgi:hypothetical protein
MNFGMGCQIHDPTESEAKLGSGCPVFIDYFHARNSAKPASIKRRVPKMCSKVTMIKTFVEKRFIA